MRARFGDIGVADAESLYKAVNAVHRGYIRTEADEVQYNLHIMLRFDLERALMAGDLEVADLEAAWNDRFKADFGYGVDKPSNGVCRMCIGPLAYLDIFRPIVWHVYAGCLHTALRSGAGLDADWLWRYQCGDGVVARHRADSWRPQNTGPDHRRCQRHDAFT